MPPTRTKVLTVSALKKRLNALRRHKTVVFTNGCFDILHWGHVSYLEAAKGKRSDRVLVIGLNSDRSVRSLNKGDGRPIVPQRDRARVLAALQCVDFVVLFNEPTPYELIKALKPDVLVKGADWKGRRVAGDDIVRKVEFIRYVTGLSTTNIIEKIKTLCAA